MKYIYTSLLISVVMMSSVSQAQDTVPILEGLYIGQKPPGLTPEVFAPGIISTEHRDWTGSFTPNMKEYYFARYNKKSGITSKVIFKSKNNQWHESEVEPRLGGSISPDGKTMHSGKRYRVRTDDGWSDLKSLGSPFEDIGIMTLTASLKGTYVFDERGTNGNGVLRYSQLIDGKREAPKPFSNEINTGIWTAHPFIAPDESYIIWDSENDGGYGGVDLYISFRQQDGSWGGAINFGDKINTEGPDSGGYVTPDGKYFFFNRKISPEDSDVYWVDAQIIETLRPRVEEASRFAPEISAADRKLSFKDIPILEEAFINSAPTDRKDGIHVGELGIDGGNKQMILKLAQEIVDNKHGDFDSFLIYHQSKLLFESYYSRGRVNLPHPQASATKSYTGLVLGRAVQLGYLTMSDLDKPLVSFLKDLDSSKFAQGVEKITLHQALTMTTGIRVSSENKKKIRNDPKFNGQKLVQALLEHSAPITAEAQMFKYSDGPELVMQVIGAVVPGTAQDFIKNEFLDKMGITNYDWRTVVSGLPKSGGGVSITSRDMIKLGTLAMNKGRWQGEQLIPEAFMTQAISRINYSADDVDVFGGGKDTSNQSYGYFWWGADLKNGNKSYFSASAQGGGGQFIIFIDELDLIVVATGRERHPAILQMTAEMIIPAFIVSDRGKVH